MHHNFSYLYWAASVISSHLLASQNLFPSQTQLTPLLPGMGMEPRPPSLPVNLPGVLSPHIQGPWAECIWWRKCPIQGVQSPLRGTMSAGWRVDARATHSPGSKSLANKTLTFPCSNLFGHFWEFQRNDGTLVTKPSPTCLNSPCCSRTGIVWNHLSFHCSHQVTSCQTKVTFSSVQGHFVLNCSQWGHQLFLTLHTKLYFCLYFKQLEHKHKAKRISH